MAEFNPIATGLEIGQGEAQVFKPFQDNYADKIAELQVKKAAETEKKKAEMGGELDKLNKIAIHPNDQPYFSGEIGKIREFAAKNGESLWKGNDPLKEMEFQQLLNDFTTKAEYSKSQRDKVEGLAMDYAKNPDKVGKSQMDYIQAYTPIDAATGKMVQPDFNKLSYNMPPKKDEVGAILEESDKLFKPNQRIVKTRDADGRVVETTNEFFNNPTAQAEYLLQKEPIKAWAIQQFEQLPPDKQDKYESRAVKSGNTVYVELLTDFNSRRGLKTSSEDLAAVEKGGGMSINIGNGGAKSKNWNFNLSKQDEGIKPLLQRRLDEYQAAAEADENLSTEEKERAAAHTIETFFPEQAKTQLNKNVFVFERTDATENKETAIPINGKNTLVIPVSYTFDDNGGGAMFNGIDKKTGKNISVPLTDAINSKLTTVFDNENPINTLSKLGKTIKVPISAKPSSAPQGVKPQGAVKTIPATTIKSLVGKKGYEGYSEKELMDYYKSQGYTVK